MDVWIEIDPHEFETYTDEGHPDIDPPPHLAHLFGDADGRCARGDRCLNFRTERPFKGPGVVGYWLYEDDDRPYRSGMIWNTCFSSSLAPELIFCEDCVDYLADGVADGETVLAGNDGDVHWFIDVAGLEYDVRLCAFDRTHGLDWEMELGSYDSLSAAVSAADVWMAAKAAADANLEAKLDALYADDEALSSRNEP